MSTETLHLGLEASVDRSLHLSKQDVHVSGMSTSLALAALSISASLKERPNIFVFPTKEAAEQFIDEVALFDPEKSVHFLPSFEVSPYSGLYPSHQKIYQRIRWLSLAQRGRGLFVATTESLQQKTLPPELLADSLHEFHLGDELPTQFLQELAQMGYSAVPTVSEAGQYAMRGGILDIFSPALANPIRVELFGDNIETIRSFDPSSQRSLGDLDSFIIAPPREIIFGSDGHNRLYELLAQDFGQRGLHNDDSRELLHSLRQKNYFYGADFLLSKLYSSLASPLEHFLSPVYLWNFDTLEASRQLDRLRSTLRTDYENSMEMAIHPRPEDLYFLDSENISALDHVRTINISKINLSDNPLNESSSEVDYRTSSVHWSQPLPTKIVDIDPSRLEKLKEWKKDGFRIFILSSSSSQFERLKSLFSQVDFTLHTPRENERQWKTWLDEQGSNDLHLIRGYLPQNSFFPLDKIIFLKEEDFLGRRRRTARASDQKEFQQKASALSFSELKEGDLIVHSEHGIGVYQGLEVMDIGGAPSEFIKLSYKDGDRLFIPIYRIGQIQKYSGPSNQRVLDKLGSNHWNNVKSKVTRRLKDIAADLLALYAKRAQLTRPAFPQKDDDFYAFENSFPYEETEDQEKTIDAVISDMESEHPMDRLVCGDVGFGKTEVAMRAAFKAVQAQKQVAILAPTTVLSFQHFENFKKRFKGWPINIQALNRFVDRSQAKEVVQGLRDGSVDIVIGTHRLLSKDIQFKDLGLLIVDEEQKFGVTHKEKIRKIKTSVDTLKMSATPIPRTLNMSLMNIHDLSLITTAPVDRLPTRTFVCKPSNDLITKAVQAEIDRGGQVFFIHNRVQSIYGVCDELRALLPKVRIRVAHGQMDEQELEKVMVAFLKHEIDVLVCTTIIESGIDIPRANTMFIDKANTYGLSQLYQLRGRVGRSKERAYCYLLLPRTGNIDPQAQERLKVIQENTALGSGIRIAQYDLELRGAGNILGEDQSGHINAVGYEMYTELLEEAVRTAKGEPLSSQVDPEINVRIPAFIPDNYIKDIRTRLAYYKVLSQITSAEDVDQVEDELRDQFGAPPEQVVNLMGLMLIRLFCKKLGIRDLSSAKTSITLAFTEHTPLDPGEVIKLTSLPNKKYSFTPDNRLRVRMNDIRWMQIYEELSYLDRLCQ